MKFNLLILLTVFSLFLFSCDDGIKFDNPLDQNADISDSSDSQNDEDKDQTDSVADEDPNEQADTENPDKKQGELDGECYPNKTCNDGLICDKDNNICIKDSESSENNDDSDSTSEQSDGDTSDSGNDNDHGDSSDSDPNLICTDEGSYRCKDNLRQQCDSGTWKTVEECEYECNTTTSKCEDDKGCKSGEYKCTSAKLSSYCENNFWKVNEECEFSCDYSTGKCKDGECTPGEHLCGDSKDAGFSYASYYCSQGYWTYDHTCSGNCDSSTGKCEIKCTTVDGKTWTDEAESTMTWQNAIDYCNNLTACGYSDWHLPTISELRTLIQNCPETVTGGECGVTDSCLSYSECRNNACSGCSYDYSSGKYSKLGDTDWFWSSSVRSDGSGYAWLVSFGLGRVNSYSKSNTDSVRCVR